MAQENWVLNVSLQWKNIYKWMIGSHGSQRMVKNE